MAAFAGALAHPARIRIVTLLRREGDLPCMRIVAALPLAQATVSQHLKVLEEVGLVTSRPDGLSVHYKLNARALQQNCKAIQSNLGTAS